MTTHPIGTIALADGRRGRLTYDPATGDTHCDGVAAEAAPRQHDYSAAVRAACELWSGRDWDLRLAPVADRALLDAAIARSGMSRRQFAVRILARDERTVRRWTAGAAPVPRAVRVWLARYLDREAVRP
jgi:hypothetical protein